jgi:hypothetical protein
MLVLKIPLCHHEGVALHLYGVTVCVYIGTDGGVEGEHKEEWPLLPRRRTPKSSDLPTNKQNHYKFHILTYYV